MPASQIEDGSSARKSFVQIPAIQLGYSWQELLDHKSLAARRPSTSVICERSHKIGRKDSLFELSDSRCISAQIFMHVRTTHPVFRLIRTALPAANLAGQPTISLHRRGRHLLTR
jgi:hypothetical protein